MRHGQAQTTWTARERLECVRLDALGGGAALRYALQSGGLFLPDSRSSIWIHGERPAQFDAARSIVRELARERPHAQIVLTSPSPATTEYLRSAFPNDYACPAPWNAPRSVRRFFDRLSPRLVLLLDGGRSFAERALERAVASGVPVCALNVGRTDSLAPWLLTAATRDRRVRLLFRDEEAADRARGIGVRPDAIEVTGSIDLDADRPHASLAAETLLRMVGVGDDTPLIVAAGVPEEEESLVLDAFGRARRARPDARLILEPMHRTRGGVLLESVRERGWTGWRRGTLSTTVPNAPWDVAVVDAPGEVLALFAVACVAIVGGTFSGDEADGYLAAALVARCPAFVGADRESLDLPRNAVADPLLRTVNPQTLATALADAVSADTLPSVPASTPRARARPAWMETTDALRDLLPNAVSEPRVRQVWHPPTLRDRAGASGLWHGAAHAFMKRRIDDWPSLRRRLGFPRSVLCLGNGPSSEDPRLADVAHDCLIRVNWRWRSRGFLTRPDLVFVGDPRTIYKVPNCIFGIWNVQLEYGMLLRHLVTRGPRPMEYITMERVSPIIRDRAWDARPTNGALAIAAAAALEPERLVISGIDLFLHRDGRYPGDVVSRNDYALSHERETDLAIIDLALRDFRGEVLILSDILREHLDRRRSGETDGL